MGRGVKALIPIDLLFRGRYDYKGKVEAQRVSPLNGETKIPHSDQKQNERNKNGTRKFLCIRRQDAYL